MSGRPGSRPPFRPPGSRNAPLRAPHVQRAIQAKFPGPSGGAAFASSPAGSRLAPHVQRAITAAQAHPAGPPPPALAPHVERALGRSGAVQRQVHPARSLGPDLGTIQPSRPVRQVRNSVKAQQLLDLLKITVAGTGAVGKVDAEWIVEKSDEKSDSSYSCDAEVWADGKKFAGSYNSVSGQHAEMVALANFVSNGSGTFKNVKTIRITKPTCPRCAYVLESLGLSDVVRYPKGTDLGNRKGPGWTMPAALKTEAWYMEPMEGEIDGFEQCGYSRDEGFGFVVSALQSV
ncbi:MAG: cytidine deaminase [Thermoanaerobaculia bacterium]